MTTLSRDLAGPDADPGAAADLAVVHDDADLTVAVVGLPTIYRFGLLAALASAGIRGTVPASSSDWSVLLDGAEPLVVVVSQEAAAGLEQVLAAARSAVPVVQVLADLSAERCAQALGDGASGVMLVEADLGDVVTVVRAAAAHEALLPRQVALSLCGASGTPLPELRPQELQWLRRLADASTVAGLARQSGYSEREMYRLLNGVYARLGATNRTEALLRAQRHGLLDDVAP
jgi:DNA-binding NarL/FixJ family response regulator